jgi:hypothetical protein
MDRMRVIDADGHFDEPQEMWLDYLEPRFHPLAPRFVQEGRPRILVGGEMKEYIAMPPGHTAGQTIAGGRDPHARMADMEKEGIDVMVMFPTIGLFFFGLERLDVSVALCRAFNDWAYDFCAVAPDRLIAPALVPQMDVVETLADPIRSADAPWTTRRSSPSGRSWRSSTSPWCSTRARPRTCRRWATTATRTSCSATPSATRSSSRWDC